MSASGEEGQQAVSHRAVDRRPPMRLSAIYEKKDGQWLVMHHHASKAATEITVAATELVWRLWRAKP